MPDASERIAELQREVAANPASRQFYQLGEMLRREGRAEEAISVLRTGLVHHPRYVAAWVSLGRALIEAAEAVAAGKVLQRAIELDSQNPVAWRLLGEARLMQGNRLGALSAMQQALELAPGDEMLAAAVDALSGETLPPEFPSAAAAASAGGEGAASASAAAAAEGAGVRGGEAPVGAPAAEVALEPAAPAAGKPPAEPVGEEAPFELAAAPPALAAAELSDPFLLEEGLPGGEEDVFGGGAAEPREWAGEAVGVAGVPSVEARGGAVAVESEAPAQVETVPRPAEPALELGAELGEVLPEVAPEVAPEVPVEVAGGAAGEELGAEVPAEEVLEAAQPAAEGAAPAAPARWEEEPQQPLPLESMPGEAAPVAPVLAEPVPAQALAEPELGIPAPPAAPPLPQKPATAAAVVSEPPLAVSRPTVTLARLHIQQQDYAGAVAILEQILDLQPANQEARDLLELVRDMLEASGGEEQFPPLSLKARKIAALQRWLASLTLGRERWTP